MRFAAAGVFRGYVRIQGSLSRESSQLHECSQLTAIADVATIRVVDLVVDEPGGDALQGEGGGAIGGGGGLARAGGGVGDDVDGGVVDVLGPGGLAPDGQFLRDTMIAAASPSATSSSSVSTA